jgi:diguanylate cyclase (GGDEF)-like protein/PAS domain S-box-containing protein
MAENESGLRVLVGRDAGRERDELTLAGAVAEGRLPEVDAGFERAFSNAPIGMALVDATGRFLQVNAALCRITGYSDAELRATTLQELTHPEDVDLDADKLSELTAGTIGSYQVEKRYQHAFGHYAWLQLTASLVSDDQGEPLYLICHIQDISERKELESHLAYLVDHDFLTGLLNRRRFEEELRLHADQVARYGVAGALLVIDLDNFKDVNDSFGHKAGDDLLKGIVGLLRQRTRQTDVLARLGGDEFGLLLPRADAAQARTVADELVKALHRHVATLGEKQVHISVSIGATLFDGLSDAEVLAYADLALYEAKEAGRNRFSLYDPSAARRARASTRIGEAERIRAALEQDRFFLCCQPIVDLSSDRVCRYELLLRLQEESGREPLPPSAFLYSAERFGLIEDIDAWVVRQAIALLAQAAGAGRSLILHVNLSGKSIGNATPLTLIESSLSETGIDPACLIFELTETSAIANIEQAKSFAERLRALGCHLALDNFGSGFGSFFYLKNLPFDYLKIDGGYIRNLAASPMDRLVVESLVTIAQGMGKKTIAEFVLEAEVASLLRRIGVDYGQGYHFGMPRPVSDVLTT